MKRVAFAILLSFFLVATTGSQVKNQSPGIPAKQTNGPSAKQERVKGSITGCVFAISKGGDLKPARMAKIYLFFTYADGNQQTHTDSSGFKFLLSLSAEIRKKSDLVASGNAKMKNREEFCKGILATVDTAILLTLQWAKEQEKSSQLDFADADEEGRFRIDGVTPGTYVIVARGRAGASDAYWEEEITIKPSTTLSVKLAQPSEVCLDVS
jgi:hypothetical protein